jgi:hypothetical protein
LGMPITAIALWGENLPVHNPGGQYSLNQHTGYFVKTNNMKEDTQCRTFGLFFRESDLAGDHCFRGHSQP